MFSSLPAVQRFLARVEALPGVRDYLQSRHAAVVTDCTTVCRPEMVDIGVKPMLEPREKNTSVQIKMIPGKA